MVIDKNKELEWPYAEHEMIDLLTRIAYRLHIHGYVNELEMVYEIRKRYRGTNPIERAEIEEFLKTDAAKAMEGI